MERRGEDIKGDERSREDGKERGERNSKERRGDQKRGEERKEREGEGGVGISETGPTVLSLGTGPCHLTPAAEWAWIPCPLGRKLRPADRNSEQECVLTLPAQEMSAFSVCVEPGLLNRGPQSHPPRRHISCTDAGTQTQRLLLPLFLLASQLT